MKDDPDPRLAPVSGSRIYYFLVISKQTPSVAAGFILICLSSLPRQQVHNSRLSTQCIPRLSAPITRSGNFGVLRLKRYVLMAFTEIGLLFVALGIGVGIVVAIVAVVWGG